MTLRLLALLLPAFGFASAVAAADEEAYDLRGPAPKKGQVITYEAKSSDKDAVRTIKAGDRTIEDKFDEVTTIKKEIEVLGVEGHDITKMRTKVLKYVADEIRTKGKRTSKKSTPNKLDGQFIYSEMVKGNWKHTLEDVKPTDEQKKALKEYQPFKSEDALLPEGKVKVGGEWKVTTEQFKKVFGTKIQDLTGTGTGKLVRVEKGDDGPIAIIDMDFVVTGKSKDEDTTLEITLSAKQTTRRSLKTGYDLTTHAEGKLALKGKADIDGEKVDVEFAARVEEDESWKLKEPK
jgi:hypothetical protein